jgi:hypothetical protein
MAFALEHFFLPKRAATVALSRNALKSRFRPQKEIRDVQRRWKRSRSAGVLVGEDARRFRPRTSRAP